MSKCGMAVCVYKAQGNSPSKAYHRVYDACFPHFGIREQDLTMIAMSLLFYK